MGRTQTMGRWVPCLITLSLWFTGSSCNVDALLNRTASFGGDTAGERGTFQVVIINNTPYRAIFTAAAYDDLDQNSVPFFQQFGNNPDRTPLEANSTSSAGALRCSRVFGIGTPKLIELMEDNVDEERVDRDALVEGIYFSSGELGSEEGALPDQGVAPPFEARLGVDFPCSGFVVIRLELDDVGPNPFRVDIEVIPAEDDRNPPA